MANRILKGLAVATGTGLAMGLTSGRSRSRVAPGHPAAQPDNEFPDIEPLLDRLERLEARLESIGLQPYDYAAAMAEMERRLEENSRELGLLRESAASVQRQIGQTRDEMPAVVEKHVASRIVSSRIGVIEKTLREQAELIEALSLRTAATDHNLQRLVSAVERLCERAQLIASGQPAAQPETRLPFESQLHDAMRREPVVPVLRTEEPVA